METLMHPADTWGEFITGGLLIASSIGVISLRNPVHASLSFLFTLLLLATLYIELGSEFIGIMQVLVYAGAILVIFMFVIILFQDAHVKMHMFKAKSNKYLLYIASAIFLSAIVYFVFKLLKAPLPKEPEISSTFGTVQKLGEALYIDFFFPFEAIIFLFLVAIVGSLYIAKKPVKESSS
jgi:NADH-quinone oxidoreductase subunit J